MHLHNDYSKLYSGGMVYLAPMAKVRTTDTLLLSRLYGIVLAIVVSSSHPTRPPQLIWLPIIEYVRGLEVRSGLPVQYRINNPLMANAMLARSTRTLASSASASHNAPIFHLFTMLVPTPNHPSLPIMHSIQAIAHFLHQWC